MLQTRIGSPNELHASSFAVLGEATFRLDPQPRSDFDPFDERLTEQMLDYRHIYLRNPKVMAVLQFRSRLMRIVREWFYQNRFMEFDAPILTPTPLYDGKTAMSIKVHGENLFLSQCAGFYLEAAAHAFERVFNMGPSFRGEESRSKRHLMEYWHIKAELAFGDREDIMRLVEDILGHVTRECQNQCQDLLDVLGTDMCIDGLKVPFPRITYEEAVTYLQSKGYDAEFGKAISTAEEEELSKLYQSPFWIVGIPRSVEPFPYVIDPNDTRVTMVADLIASNGYGELLGIAEKIHDSAMLDERLDEKGKLEESRYQFVRDVHAAGCVPHIAFGMGLERLIRWLLNIAHVRDTIPFPRVVRRRVYP
jgi:asparaginyl-tRNA synthetase